LSISFFSSHMNHLLFLCLYLIFYYFFFQAEDGIRDRNVTGVQTCALPIFFSSTTFNISPEISLKISFLKSSLNCSPISPVPHPRSEERRVGKECSSRRSS